MESQSLAAANETAPNDGPAASEPPLSKNQQKKRLRWEKALAIKKRRKEQSRQVRIIKAQHDGRDLDKERELQRQNEQEGKGWERREEKWKQLMKDADVENAFRVCFDCSFEDHMTWKETNSLGLQLRYTYAMNRKSSCPVYIDVCSLKKGGDTRAHMEKVAGFPERWVGRAFSTHEACLEEVYGLRSEKDSGNNGNNNNKSTEGGNDEEGLQDSESKQKDSHCAEPSLSSDAKPKRHLVYLTGDSPNILTTLDNDTTYVIGGIVDRNRLKRAAIDRAESLNISTARLPLDEHLDFKGSTRILTCNHVFEILLKYRENGYKDWRAAILSVLPGRKEVQEKNGGAVVDEDEAESDGLDKSAGCKHVDTDAGNETS
ncbi:hypothetical protein HJC23_013136 [Cyclotella cryptica]|uniref:tRNA (guanine(9)-N(1))-methyltransferase n=1 Tax=Cyclotella cryptica TaxID=29204 RepID=A0ABD3QNX9_9STRA